MQRKRATLHSGTRFQLPSSAPCDRSVSGKHATPPRSQGEFESPRSLAVLVQPARDTAFRARVIGVRIPGTVPMESEPDRGRASLLTTARVTPWCSSHPFSSEDEPARRLAPAGNRAALRGGFRILRLPQSPACSHRAGDPWRVNPPGLRAPFRTRVGAQALGFEFSALRPGRCAAGAAAGFEHPRGITPGRSTLPPSAPGSQRSSGMRLGPGFKWRGNG